MCGIWGSLNHQSQPGDAHLAARMNALMARRGPDGAGVWTDDAYCTLGFRRLAILDLSPAGSQPMCTPDGRYVLVINGEIYNFRQIRAQLQQHGIAFRSSGDSEVALQALAYWGKPALERFNGMFALALYDSLEKKLLLARDHAGIKPLYYLDTPQGLVFASQYDQIMAHPWAARLPVSNDALGLYLRLGYLPAPYALLEHTAMLEPGAWLEIQPGQPPRRGRHFTFPRQTQPDLRGQAAFEAVDAAVSAAVERQMVSDVPLGTFLSGGIDSPLVAACAQQASSQPLRAYTIRMADQALDESTEASAYARQIGVQHVLQSIRVEDLSALVGDAITAASEPFADYSIIPTMLVAQLARQTETVMLSGDGGDELFWGYPGRFGSVLRVAEQFAQPYWLRSARRAVRRVLYLGSAHPGIRYPNIGRWYLDKHARLGEQDLRRIFPACPPMPAAFDAFHYTGHDVDATAGWLRWNEFTTHLTMVLLKVDRASMFHSLEVRVPLLDREVIDTALRVDWRSCLAFTPERGKIPLREALARRVSHQTQSKRGFQPPMAQWLRGPLRPLLEQNLLDRRELLGLALQPAALRSFFDAFDQGKQDRSYGLWLLLSLSLWEQRYRSVSG